MVRLAGWAMPGASDREALAALGAAALQRQPAGLRLHALAKAVCACALALLRLVGALHGRRGMLADRVPRRTMREGFPATCGGSPAAPSAGPSGPRPVGIFAAVPGPQRSPAPFRRASP